METIKLDLIPGKKMPSLHASQYDDGREHGIDLFENGVAYKLDGTETLTINERKGDDCICSLDIENTFADTNHIEFASTEQMCAVWGNNICELVIAKGEKTIGTLNFILEIEQSPTEGGIESESEIKNLERQIEAITEEVIGDDYYTAEQTDEAIETATEGKANTTYVDTELANKADKSNTYTKTEVDTLIDNLPEPMIFKGTLGVGGTIQSLPDASASNEGYTYKVITDGTYAGQTAKVGDVFTSNGSAWVYIPSGDEDNDTWRAIKVNGVEKLGNGISSGAVDFEDTANVKFEFDANGNKVRAKLDGIYTDSEVDDLLDEKADKSNTYTQEQVNNIVSDAIYNILPSELTPTGAVANFSTTLELPIKSLGVDVNAVQEAGTPTPSDPKSISGWSQVKLTRCKKNLIDKSNYGAVNNSNIVWGGGLTGYADGTLILKAGTYTISASVTCTGFYIQDSSSQIAVGYNRTSLSFTINEEKPIRIQIYKSGIDQEQILGFDYQLELGSSVTDYEPYNGNTEVINLGGTYYGGHFTQDKDGHRQFEVTHALTTVSEMDNNRSWYYSTSNGFWINEGLANTIVKTASGSEVTTAISDYFETVSRNNLKSADDRLCVNTSGYVCIYGSELSTTKNEFLSSVGNAKLVYPLATPYIINLPDGEPIITLNGTNNIYADTGDCAVEYKCSVAEYVANHSGGSGAKSLGGVFLGGSNSGSEEEPTEESEETEKTKEIDEPKEEIKTIGDTKK